MTSRSPPETSAETLANIVIARARSRLAVTEVTDEYNLGLLSIFRDEIGACVSRVSTFLLAVITSENYDLDALAWSIRPARGWPFRSMARGRGDRLPLRHGGAKDWAHRQFNFIMRNGGGPVFPLREDGRARVRVIEDCLDVCGTVGGVRFATAGSRLRVTVPWPVPRSVDFASIDRPLCDVVGLVLLANRDWPVVAVERSSDSRGCTFVADVGSRPYTLPWNRPP